MTAILLIFILGFAITNVESSGDYILYGSSGRDKAAFGLYGGYYEFGKKGNLEQTHINRLYYRGTYIRYIAVNSLSYDPVSKDLLVYANGDFLARLDPCKSIRIQDENVYFRPTRNVYAGPFALYDSDIYYVAREHRVVNKVSLWMSLTIRKITGCTTDRNSFIDGRGHDRLECSVEVAKILDEEIDRASNVLAFRGNYARHTAENLYTIGSTLLVVKKDGKLYFFVQIAKPMLVSSK